MKNIWYILVLCFGSQSQASEVFIKPGETISLPASGKAWVENSKILQLSDSGKFFSIRGKLPGVSLVKIGKKSYDVFILSPSQEKAWNKLTPTIEKTLGLSLSLAEGKVAVKGDLIRWVDWEKLYYACKNSDCEYSLMAKIKDPLKLSAQKKIAEIFQQNGLPPQNIMFDQQVQALVSNSGEVSKRTTKLLKAFGIAPIHSASNVDLVPLVKVQITVAEVRKDGSLNYGVKWPESYSAQILPSYAPSSTSQMFDVHFLEKSGVAKILASPNILCRSGKEANFFAGGEFPIKILNYKIQDVVWKKYGIILNVKPVADFSGKMSISIETEVSSIDKSRTVDGLPALFTNKIQSHFELNGPRTIALSGLIKSEQGENASGLPGLSRIPILGNLFSSKEFIDNRTELVVFVKPEVVSPGTLEANL